MHRRRYNENMKRRKIYVNLDPGYRNPGRKQALGYLLRRLGRGIAERPGAAAQERIAADEANRFWETLDPGHNIAAWVGHSTVLCRQEGHFYITDPIFSDRASPFPIFGPRRYTQPAFEPEEMPKIDFVLISHSHYDHLDLPSVLALQRLHKPTFFVPEGLKRWFKHRGIFNAIEVPWWGEVKHHGLTVHAVPAQHYSVRTPFDRNKSHWCGWVVKGERSFYYPGDTGLGEFFMEVGHRHGPIDLAAIPIGCYSPEELIKQHHLNPEEALEVFKRVRGRKFLAIHWGAFDMTEEPWDEPPSRLMAEAARRGMTDEGLINIIRIGDPLEW